MEEFEQYQPSSHGHYLKIRTEIGKLADQLSPSHTKIIEQYAAWFRALSRRYVICSTQAQVHFVAVSRGDEEPDTEYEKAWVAYKAAIKAKLEASSESPDRPNQFRENFLGRKASLMRQIESRGD